MNLAGVQVNPLTLPILLAQGWWVRRVTPRLPDATGPIEGCWEGAQPGFDLVVIGESPVAGIGAPTHREALTGQVAFALRQMTGQAVRWLALGQSGATVRAATEQLVPHLAGRRADAAVVAFGVNDSLKQRAAEEWKRDLRQMITAIRNQVGAVPIVLAGVPPLNEFPAFPQRLGQFLGTRSALLNQASRVVEAEMVAVEYAPMVGNLGSADFCEDRFHPSVSGYAAWGTYLAQLLSAQLTDKPGNRALPVG